MTDRLITIYSDRQKEIQPQLSQEEQCDILALKDLLGSQHVSLSANNILYVQHYVGFIVSGKTRLQILPKIYADYVQGDVDIEEEKQASVELLLRLLSFSGYLNYKDIPTPQCVDECNGDLFEIFISIFASRFLEIIKRSLCKSYESYEDNRQFVKGKILFQETILKNPSRRDKHYVRYDEFSENTLLNRLFKTVLLQLLPQTKLNKNKKKLRLALNCLDGIEPISMYRGIFKEIVFNRMTEVYRPIFTLAKLFYCDKQPGFSEGKEFTFTFLVPLNKLFEYYAYKLICNYMGREFSVRYQGPEKHLAEHNEKKYFWLSPDITIFRDEWKFPIGIVDAKFKNPFDKNYEVALTSGDIYQIVTYALCYQCENVFLLYPRFRGQQTTDGILKDYKIPTKAGEINLIILQIDIMETDSLRIQREIGDSVISKCGFSAFVQ